MEAINTSLEASKGEETMEIEFNCPKCNQKLAVDQFAAGATVNCPTCSASLVVPGQTPIKTIRPPTPMKRPPPLSTPAASPKRAKGLAITSLVLGIIGLVPILGLATGLLGLALGITALVKRTTSKGVAIAGTVVGGIATLLIPVHIIVLVTAVSVGRFAAQSAVCAAHLKTIGLSIASYQEKHNGAYPANLNMLVTDGLIPAPTLHCPVHAGPGSGCDYGYAQPTGSQGNGMLAWDSDPHRAVGKGIAGRTVLYKDLSVRFVMQDEFQREFAAVAQSALKSQPNFIRPAKPRQDISSDQRSHTVKSSPIAVVPPPKRATSAASVSDSKPNANRTRLMGFGLASKGWEDFSELGSDGARLIGFQVGLGKFVKRPVIHSVQPVFLTEHGEVLGKQYGTFDSDPVVIKAKPGYAVGGITVKAGLGIDGFSVTFMRIKGDVLDSSDTYTSDWIGGKGGGRETLLTGSGVSVRGVFGRVNPQNKLGGLGLILGGQP